MYLTPDNAPEYLGRKLYATRPLLGVYPYEVIKWPDGTFGVKDRVGICMPISNDPFNQVWFDSAE